MPPFLGITPQTLRFDRSSDQTVDVTAFTDLVDACEKHDHSLLAACEPCQDRQRRALALWRGPFLDGFSPDDSAAFEEWSLLERERLQRLLVQTLQRIADSDEWHGEHGRAVRHLRRWVELEPWDEGAHRQLMRLLALSGQRSLALAQYKICCRTLRDELDVGPSGATTRLYEQIRAGSVGAPEPMIASPRPRHNLPAQATPFIGRIDALKGITARLLEPACRLLTLVGPGGSGKTRLALEAARPLVDTFRDGVFFVPLAGIRSSNAIAPTAAQAIGLPLYGTGSPEDQLLSFLGNRGLLLVMDNFEHLLAQSRRGGDDGAMLLTRITEAAPDKKLLVTSRVALNVLD